MGTRAKAEGSSGPWRGALALGLIALIATAVLAGVNQITRQRIQEQERRAVLKQLGELIPPERYTNVLYDDYYSLADKTWFPSGQTVTIYRARSKAGPVAVVIRLAATDGYNGNIHLLVGINADGSLSGVRVTSHKETPGLGDAIETGKSDWILGFSGLSLRNPDPDSWAVKRDGGVFDQFTGATITPRAVVKAVRRALQFYAANKNELFAHLADTMKATDP